MHFGFSTIDWLEVGNICFYIANTLYHLGISDLSKDYAKKAIDSANIVIQILLFKKIIYFLKAGDKETELNATKLLKDLGASDQVY